MTAGVRCRWWVLSRVGMSLVSKKRNMFFLDSRFRRNDGRGWVSVRDSSPPSPLGLTRGSRAKSPYFGGALRAGKAELVFLDARIRKHDLSPSRHARPRSGIQDSKSLFCRCVKGRKSGIIDTGSSLSQG